MSRLLHIGTDHSRIGDVELRVGWRTLPADVEAAIAAIEDEIARIRTTVAEGQSASSSDPVIREIAVLATAAPSPDALAIEAVEQLFERQVARQPRLPADRQFPATLLILRELMHHLGIGSVRMIR